MKTERNRRIRSCWMGLIVPIAAAAIILLGVPGDGFAQAPEKGTTPFRLGAMDIFPGFSVGVAYDDNIFQTQRNEESDTIIHYTPSIAINLPFAAASSATARAEFDIQDFSDNDSEDAENITLEGGLNLERIYGRFYSRTTGRWLDTEESSSSEEQSAIGTGRDRTELNLGTAAGFGGYDDDKSRLEVNGGFFESGELLLQVTPEYPLDPSGWDYTNKWRHWVEMQSRWTTNNNAQHYYGVKTWVNNLIQHHSESTRTPQLASTPIQPYEKVTLGADGVVQT